MLRVGGRAIDVATARARAVFLCGLARVTDMAERLEVNVGVGAAVHQPDDVVHFGGLDEVSVP